MDTPNGLFDLTPVELSERVSAIGAPAYRVRQLLQAVYSRLADSYGEIVELPAELRARLADEVPFSILPVLASRQSADGSTEKVLLRLGDGNTVEAVLMQYDPTEAGRALLETVCVSTQVGCAMGCIFCATGQQGFLRNLAAGEIVQQVLHFARLLKPLDRRVTNVVFMGMGEPLANYEAALKSVRILTSPEAFGLGARHVTVSTVGLVPQMRRLSGEGLQVGLAVSLHSADDALRRRLVPTAHHPVAEILAAADGYTAATGRRYSVEYALIDNVNDTPSLASLLAQRLHGRNCHVNLIPLNPTGNAETKRSARRRVLAFERVLLGAGINATVRVEKGVDIAAGCGQLRGAEAGRHAVSGIPPSTAGAGQVRAPVAMVDLAGGL